MSPPDQDQDLIGKIYSRRKPKKERRYRVPYTEEEEDNLIEGVRTLGKHWNQILMTYSFHPSRTNVDLMEKYKRMVVSTELHPLLCKYEFFISPLYKASTKNKYGNRMNYLSQAIAIFYEACLRGAKSCHNITLVYMCVCVCISASIHWDKSKS